jgi:hypothetical protein
MEQHTALGIFIGLVISLLYIAIDDIIIFFKKNK